MSGMDKKKGVIVVLNGKWNVPVIFRPTGWQSMGISDPSAIAKIKRPWGSRRPYIWKHLACGWSGAREQMEDVIGPPCPNCGVRGDFTLSTESSAKTEALPDPPKETAK